MTLDESLVPFANIPALLTSIKQTRPHLQPGLSFYDGEKRLGTLSYGGYLAAVEGLAALLRELGVRRGDKVATLWRNCLEVPITYLALMSLGATVVPLNPDYSLREMRFVVEDSGVIGLITDRTTLHERESVFDGLRFIRTVDELDYHRPGLSLAEGFDISPEHPAIILYTSGTTSFPKGVVQSHGALIANAWSMVRALKIETPNQYSVMPFYHAHAVGFGMMTCLLSGGHLIVASRMDPRCWATVVRQEQVTVTSMVPNLLHLLLRTRLHRSQVPALRFIFVSAAPLPTALARDFEAQSGLKLAHAWGLSEFTNFATCLPLEVEAREALLFDEPTPCIGRAVDGVEVTVVDPDGREVSEGDLGQLLVKGPSLMLGYHNNPTETAKVTAGGWLHSGDEGYFRTVGGRKYFFITDRIKDIIIRSGQKISPAAVEAEVIRSVPELVNSVVALGFPHEHYGEEIGLVVETEDFAAIQPRLEQAVSAMPIWQRPKVILHAPKAIARTHTGKMQRRMLRPLFDSFHKTAAGLVVRPVASARAGE